MVSHQVTKDEVAAVIRREMRGRAAAAAELDEDTALADLGLSSLQVAEVVFTLEEDHGIEFDPARAADAAPLGDLVALCNEALAARTSS
ncbi:acyl carrier protein [Streptomyces sp. B1866]|uniref:acyl carrier protein n=1 Tax=Streptomyces sp. B1866 TaxID=3075431 RepID=UPI00288EFAD6|nr:acyl carrier protein [Streptomyces sp. B1866]MDT3397410.1 acyl carrier protein [Streptomyces sp. B1866]